MMKYLFALTFIIWGLRVSSQTLFYSTLVKYQVKEYSLSGGPGLAIKLNLSKDKKDYPSILVEGNYMFPLYRNEIKYKRTLERNACLCIEKQKAFTNLELSVTGFLSFSELLGEDYKFDTWYINPSVGITNRKLRGEIGISKLFNRAIIYLGGSTNKEINFKVLLPIWMKK